MAGRLEGKAAIVTGAGSGIGRAIALRFAAEGAAVVVNDLDGAAAARTTAEIAAAGGRARVVAADVTRRETGDRLVQAALDAFGRLDVFHNNAGGAVPTPMGEIDEAHYRRVLDLNLDAVWYGMQAALRAMVPQRRGCILTTSSSAGLGGVPGLSAYGAAKAGVIQLTRTIAIEYGPLGIRANAICPGPMSTPQMEAWLATLGPAGERFGRQVPLGRLGYADEIAPAAVFLASDEASYVTGAVLAVDGGVSATLASPRVE